MSADPNHLILTGRKPVHPPQRDRRRPDHHQRQLLAHVILGPAGPGHVCT